MSSVTVSIGKENYTTQVTMPNHQLIADEPEELGGKDLGPSPFELLSSALGTCTAITMKMYADRKEWPIEEIKIQIKLKQEKEGTEMHSFFEQNIEIIGDLDEKQRARMLLIAGKCPVHKTLKGEVKVETTLV